MLDAANGHESVHTLATESLTVSELAERGSFRVVDFELLLYKTRTYSAVARLLLAMAH